jgi:hypothetical protein
MAYSGLTGQEIEARIAALLLRPFHAVPATAAILQTFVVNTTIREICRQRDWTALGETVTGLTITAGTREVPAPDRIKNHLRPYWLDANTRHRISGEYRDESVTMEWIREHYPDPTDTDSEPLYFTVHGANLVIVPTLSADVSFELDCNRFPADLAPAGRNWFTENCADAIIFLGAALGSKILNEETRAQHWAAMGAECLKSAMNTDLGEQISRTGPLSAHVGSFDSGHGWR